MQDRFGSPPPTVEGPAGEVVLLVEGTDIRHAGKLDFDIEEATAEPMYELAPLLLQIPPARMFEEVLKLFGAEVPADAGQLDTAKGRVGVDQVVGVDLHRAGLGFRNQAVGTGDVAGENAGRHPVAVVIGQAQRFMQLLRSARN